jgi:hypothetical protein
VFVAAGSPYHFTVNSGTGILTDKVLGLSLSSGATAYVDAASNQQNRQLVVIDGAGLFLSGGMNSWTSRLDVANNDLDLPGALLSTVTSQIKEGYANGSWTGEGIVSSTAASNSKQLTALGVIQNDNDPAGLPIFSTANPFDGVAPGIGDVLVKYTYFGDANLDGKVDGSDYSLIDSGYLSDKENPGSAIGWYNGDFNYDGTIDGSDYTLIDNAFNTQGAAISPTAQVAPTGLVAVPVTVPEPSMAATFAAIAIGFYLRRLRAVKV